MTDLFAIDRAVTEAWPARERDALNGWALNADSGLTGRPNAVAPMSWTGGDLEADITSAEEWLRDRGLTPQFRITESACEPAHLTEALAARGYARSMPTLVMDRALGPIDGDETVRLRGAPGAAFDAVMTAAAAHPEDTHERRGIIARAPDPKVFAEVTQDAALAAIGMCVVTGDLAGVFAMRTAPDARRRGHARRILRALLAWAHEQRATAAYLQVEEDNPSAIALYASEGFVTRGRYWYWKAPSPAAS